MPLRHARPDHPRGQARGSKPLRREDRMISFETSRREFLKGTGALVVSFALAGRWPALAQGVPAAGKPVALDEVDSFLAIEANGRVTVFSGKVDLGTGVRTALTQM